MLDLVGETFDQTADVLARASAQLGTLAPIDEGVARARARVITVSHEEAAALVQGCRDERCTVGGVLGALSVRAAARARRLDREAASEPRGARRSTALPQRGPVGRPRGAGGARPVGGVGCRSEGLRRA